MISRGYFRPTLARITTTSSFLLFMLRPLTGSAQSAGNKAAAEELFDHGKSLMQSGDYSQACQKFEASQKLDAGIGTLLYLGDCYERLGRTASAWATFKEAASTAGAQGQESRKKLANERAKALEPNLVRLTVDVAKDDPALLGFEVLNDNVAIPQAQYGIAVPVDPGEHRIDASAPGKRTFTTVVKITKADSRVAVPLLEDLPAPSTATLPTTEAKPAASSQSSSVALVPAVAGSPEKDAPSGNGHRIAGVVIGGVGLVGLGIGSYFGLTAIHNHNQSKQTDCPSGDVNACYETRLSQYNDATNEAKISTVAFIAGGALAVTGLVIYLTAPSDMSGALHAQAAFDVNGGRVGLGGVW